MKQSDVNCDESIILPCCFVSLPREHNFKIVAFKTFFCQRPDGYQVSSYLFLCLSLNFFLNI